VRHLFDNLALKLASLGLAVVLWLGIAGEKTSEMGVTVPVELQNFPQEMELTGETVNTVEVRLRASPGVIQRPALEEISARIDLAEAHEGERIVHLTPEAIQTPFGVTVVRINPAILTLHLERTLEKSLPVRPRLLGIPGPGFEVAQLRADPPEVVIRGPRSRVREISSAFTEAISVDGARASITKEVAVGLEDPALRIEGIPRVQVTVNIRETYRQQAFEALPLGVRGGKGAPQTQTVSVTVTGPPSVIERVRPEDVRPYVDVTGMAPGSTPRLPVGVELAAGLVGVNVYAIEPPEVTVGVGGAR
jgi:YbbR domain-containing protein